MFHIKPNILINIATIFTVHLNIAFNSSINSPRYTHTSSMNTKYHGDLQFKIIFVLQSGTQLKINIVVQLLHERSHLINKVQFVVKIWSIIHFANWRRFCFRTFLLRSCKFNSFDNFINGNTFIKMTSRTCYVLHFGIVNRVI